MFGTIDLTTPPPAYHNLMLSQPGLMTRAAREGLDAFCYGHGMRVRLVDIHMRGSGSTNRRRMRFLYPDGRCSYCGERMRRGDDTVDHVVPRAAGGAQLGLGNMVPACKRCNNRKGDLSLLEFLLREVV